MKSEIETATEKELDFIDTIVKQYEGEEGMLIPMLQDIQAEYGYLPADHLRSLSRALKVPLARIYGVATFYASFRLSPKGQHDVTLCMGTVCYLKGSARISEVICGEYGVEPGGTTSDRLFTLNLVNCVGACALAPVMIVDGKYHDAMTPESALKILRRLSSEEREATEPEPSKTHEPAKPSEHAKPAKPSEPSVKAADAKREAHTVKRPAEAAVPQAGGKSQKKPVAKTTAKTTAKSPAKPFVKTPVKASGKKIQSPQASKTTPKKKTGKK
jgi:NADH-quinone oxidoreductase subunit E